jgi:hypothetical protein
LIERRRLIDRLKTGIWLYFLLLFFEGALRKWILPQLATPLLIVRDPVAIYILTQALRYKVWKPNALVLLAWATTIISMVTTFLFGHGNMLVTIYGMRIMIIHFPLIFIFGKILSLYDVEKMGKYLLWITIGMTILVAMQFFSPQSAFINRGIAGEEGSGFAGAAGFYRVPGTFSFTNGLSLFYGLAGCFIIYFSIRKNTLVVIPKYLLFGSIIAMIAAIPLSISRSVLFQFFLSIFFVLLLSSKNPKVLFRIGGGSILIIVLLLFLNNFTFFQTAVSVLNERLVKANKIEGGSEGIIFGRVLGGFLEPFSRSTTFFGKGLGLGSNAGAKLLTGESGLFIISEDEWGRVIGERGIIFGSIIILIRIFLAVQISIKSWKGISKDHILPWILVSFSFINLLNGQLAQPTSLGFVIISVGFIIASSKYSKK